MGRGPTWLESSLSLLIDESVSGRPGFQTIAERVADIVFVQAVRDHIASLPTNGSGWLRGLTDPQIARALARARTAGRSVDRGISRQGGRPFTDRLRASLSCSRRLERHGVRHRAAHARCRRHAGPLQGSAAGDRERSRVRIGGLLQQGVPALGRIAAGAISASHEGALERTLASASSPATAGSGTPCLGLQRPVALARSSRLWLKAGAVRRVPRHSNEDPR